MSITETDCCLLRGGQIEWLPLRNVVKKHCTGATPKKGNASYYVGGTVPWIRTQDVRFNEINSASSYITETAVKETGAKWIPPNCVIVAISGATAGRCGQKGTLSIYFLLYVQPI